MEQAIHEVRLQSGVELPIEVYDIRVECGADAPIRTPHYHEYIEFLFADRECDVDVWIAGERIRFRTGDMLIINSNAAHTFVNNLPMNSYICVKALPKVLYLSENSFYDKKYVVPFFKNSLVSYQHFSSGELKNAEVGKDFCAILLEWETKPYGYELSVKALLLKIFLWTVRYNYENGIYPVAGFTEDTEENARLIQRSVDYIELNYADVNERSAAEVVNMSYSHYSRQFKRVMGLSFCEYLNLTRINAAEKLLLSTNMSVTEVALASGFATSSHFIVNFKKIKHTTPARYRQFWGKNQNKY